MNCLETFALCGAGKDTAAECIDDAHPGFYCENETCSPYSDGPVNDDENVAFLLISPNHYDVVSGMLLPSAFREITKRDLSVVRIDRADNSEVNQTIAKIVARGLGKTSTSPRQITKACIAKTVDIRNLKIESQRVVGVLDTALEDSRNHASLFTNRVCKENKQLRARLISLVYDLMSQKEVDLPVENKFYLSTPAPPARVAPYLAPVHYWDTDIR